MSVETLRADLKGSSLGYRREGHGTRRSQASTLVLIDGVGHIANVEAPERFEWEVRTFLRSVDESTRKPM